ncbi:MAG: M6 family metalloprotease domain-containing protein [Alloprevotella sp.]|nr:M6 family metalloprotease domain-containing protein [Alloprevotella sp.]
MKRTLFSLFLLLAVAAQAIPPMDTPIAVRQSDGTTIMVRIHGQRRTEFYTTADGKVVVRNAKKDLCYAVLQGDRLVATDVVAHEPSARSERERAFLGTNQLTAEVAARAVMRAPQALRAPAQTINASTADGLGRYGQSGVGAVPSIGDVVIPVILVEFSDTKLQPTTTVEKMTRYYNEEGYHDEDGAVGSARDYFIAQSRGMFRPTFDVVGRVSITNRTAAYYGSNDKSDGFIEVVKDGMSNAVRQLGVDWKKYVQGDGIPLVAVIFAGNGEATGGGEDALWPCEYDLNSTLSGVKVRSIFIGNEVYADGSLMGMGVFCHEFGHALGLPDFYCTNYGHSEVTMGHWSIMCSGCYLPDAHARAPIGYTAYERSYLGWEDIPELTEADAVTLYQWGSQYGSNSTLVRNPRDEREYFIFEQRQPGTWYPASFGTGMFVTHVTYDSNAWYYNNLNNTQGSLRMTYLPANGTKNGRSAAELFPGSGGTRTELGPNTNPAMRLFNGATLDRPLYKITRNDDSSVSFNFLDPDFVGRTPGDVVEADGLTYRFISRAQVEVKAKENGGAYGGSVNIPESYIDGTHHYTVVGIADGAFADCPALTSVDVPATVRTISPTAFTGSRAVQRVSVAEDNMDFLSLDGVLFTNSEMVTNPTEMAAPLETEDVFDFAGNPWNFDVADNALKPEKGKLSLDIRAGNVTILPEAEDASGRTMVYLFKSSSGIDMRLRKDARITITVPEGVTLSRLEFAGSAVNLSASVGAMEGNVWTGSAQEVTFTATAATRLSTLTAKTLSRHLYAEAALLYYPAARTGAYTVPVGVSRIGAHAFDGASVAEITLSDSLLTVGERSLDAPGLRTLTARTAVPAAASGDPFPSVDKALCTLNVPAGAESAYRSAAFWQQFYGIDAISLPTAGDTAAGLRGAPVYDLQGRRVARPGRGLYVVGGRKVLVK